MALTNNIIPTKSDVKKDILYRQRIRTLQASRSITPDTKKISNKQKDSKDRQKKRKVDKP